MDLVGLDIMLFGVDGSKTDTDKSSFAAVVVEK